MEPQTTLIHNTTPPYFPPHFTSPNPQHLPTLLSSPYITTSISHLTSLSQPQNTTPNPLLPYPPLLCMTPTTDHHPKSTTPPYIPNSLHHPILLSHLTFPPHFIIPTTEHHLLPTHCYPTFLPPPHFTIPPYFPTSLHHHTNHRTPPTHSFIPPYIPHLTSPSLPQITTPNPLHTPTILSHLIALLQSQPLQCHFTKLVASPSPSPTTPTHLLVKVFVL